MLFNLRPDINWLEQAVMPLEVAARASAHLFGRTSGSRITNDLTDYARRVAGRLGGDAIDVSVLVNLAVNERVTSGARGVAFANFLAEMDIGASLVHQSNEDWVVVLDPLIVLSERRVTTNEIRAMGFDLPRIAEQYRRLDDA